MSEILSVSSRTVERDIAILKKYKKLTRDGDDNDGVWVVLTNNE